MRMTTLMIPCAILAMPALGDLPAALDRVPANAAAIIGIQSLSGFHSDLSGIAEMFNIRDLGGPLEMAEMLLATHGLNAQGSAALVIMPGEDGFVDVTGPQPTMFAILPVDSYDEMVGAFSGDAGDAITELAMGGDVVFATNLGGGFCAIAPESASLDGLGEIRGMLARHSAHVGAAGQSVIEGSDLFVALDIKAFSPAIEQKMGEMRDTFAMIQGLMGEQGAGMGQMVDMIDGLASALTEDGQSAVLGINVDADGVSLDASAQFREGSELAAMAGGGGNASALLDRVPDMPFIVAWGMDFSSPQLKSWMAEMSEAAMALQPGGANPFGGIMKTGEMMDLLDGSAFVMGEPPSLMMGGIFHNMMEFKASSDSQKLLDATRQMLPEMDGMNQGGITFNTTLDVGVKEIAGTSVDTWSMKMTPDPENPAAQQMNMAFGMIFGSNGGPNGYYAAVDGGMITTMSLNDQLMAKAIKAASEGNGLASGNKLRAAIARQPEGSVIQGFLDVGTLGKQIMAMAAMMPGIPQFEIPDNLAPVGVSLATGSGGLHGRLHVPQGIIDLISTIQEQVGDEMGGEGGGGPRF